MKYLSTVFTTALIALVIAVAALLLGPLLPIPGGLDVKIVKSGSMEPSIKTGGIVLIRPADTYSAGDVVTFGKDTKTEVPTTHRILSVYEEEGKTYFQTKGDANEEADPLAVPESAVIGRVLFSVPYAGYLLAFAREPIGFALLIAIPAGFVILSELVTVVAEVRGLMRGGKAVPLAVRKKTALRNARLSPALFFGFLGSALPRFRKRAVASKRKLRYEAARPVVDLRAFRDPNVLNLRGVRPGTYLRHG